MKLFSVSKFFWEAVNFLAVNLFCCSLAYHSAGIYVGQFTVLGAKKIPMNKTEENAS